MIRVYDLPTRVFHWLFAFGFFTAFTLANTIDDEQTTFSYHMIAGATMCMALVWRVTWGFIGTKHAKFADFNLSPSALMHYLKGALSGSNSHSVGHNPASSWAAITMMLLAACLGVTGFLMTNGPFNEVIEEVHELCANAFMLVVVLHLCGIALHTIKYRDPIGKSMLSGEKSVSGDTKPVAAFTILGVLCLVATLLFTKALVAQFDPHTRTTSIFGVTWQLSEFETDEHKAHDEHYENDGHE